MHILILRTHRNIIFLTVYLPFFVDFPPNRLFLDIIIYSNMQIRLAFSIPFTSANWTIPGAQATSWQNSAIDHRLSWVWFSPHVLVHITYCSVISRWKSLETLYSAMVVLAIILPPRWAVEYDIFLSSWLGDVGRQGDDNSRVVGLLFLRRRFFFLVTGLVVTGWETGCPMIARGMTFKSPKIQKMMEWMKPSRNIEDGW